MASSLARSLGSLCSLQVVILMTPCATSQKSPMFQAIGKNVEIMLEGFRQEMDEDIADAIRNGRGNASDECYGCMASLNFAKHIFEYKNHSFDQLQSNFQAVCRNYFNEAEQPLQGSRSCPANIKNYGPHVETIARLNQKSAEESCLFLTFCSEDDLILPPNGNYILPNSNRLFNPKFQRADASKKQASAKSIKRRKTKDDILRIAQISDIHVDEHYLEGAYSDCGMIVCCRKQPDWWPIGRLPAGPHGEYTCNVPPQTTMKFIEKLQSFQPDIVLYTGDSPPHYFWEQTLEGQMNSTLWVAKTLADHITDAPVYSTMGNHEMFPDSLYWVHDPSISHLEEVFLSAYSNLSRFGADQELSIRRAGFYSSLVRPGLRLLSYNSNFGNFDNWYSLLNDQTEHFAEMMSFMRDVLQKARDSNEKVIVIAHHPVGSAVMGFDEDVSEIMTSFSDVIIFNTVGHFHKDEFRVFSDERGDPVSVQFLAQSANSLLNVNPAVRLYHFDDETLELLDYEQHFMNLTDGNISLFYRAKEEYELPDLSPQSMKEFVWRMKEDPDLFGRFWNNRDASPDKEDCIKSEVCREQALCHLITTTAQLLKQCLLEGLPKPPQSTQSTQSTTTLPTTPSSADQNHFLASTNLRIGLVFCSLILLLL